MTVKPDWAVRTPVKPPKLPNGMLSPNFSLAEFLRSTTAIRLGIKNTPSPAVLERLRNNAANMEKVRDILSRKAGRPIPVHITSGFRNDRLNAAVGGSPTSDHRRGDSTDFQAPEFGSPIQICHALVEAGLKFDQLIEEGDWVHVSFGPRMRQEILTMRRGKYFPGLRPI